MLPKVRHGENDVRILESGFEARGIIHVGLFDFNVEGSEGLRFGRGRVAGQTADEVAIWGLGESSSNGTTLIRLAMMCHEFQQKDLLEGRWHRR